MGRGTTWSLVCLGLVLAALALWSLARTGAGEGDVSRGPVPQAVAPHGGVGRFEATSEPGAAPGRIADPQPLDVRPAPPSGQDADDRARLTARLWRPDGDPAADVPFRLSASVTAAQGGAAREPWSDVEGASDADGRVILRFDPRGLRSVRLEIEPPELVGAAWSWPTVEPGAVLDLGDVPLVEGGRVVLRVVAGDGFTLTARDDWRAWVRRLDDHPRGQTFPRWNMGGRAGDDGLFRMGPLLPGRYEARVMLGAAGWLPKPGFAVEAGRVHPVVAVYDGPPLDRRLHVKVSAGDGVPFLRPEAAMLTLRGPLGDERRPEPSPTRRHTDEFVFDGLPPGPHTLVLAHPAYRTWQQDGLLPGGPTVKVRLEGTGALDLTVRDALGGAGVPRYTADVLCVQVARQADGSIVRRGGPGGKWEVGGATGAGPDADAAQADGRQVLDRLPTLSEGVDMELKLTVEAPGHLREVLELPALRPFETRALEVSLRRAAGIAGVVVDGHGAPADAVAVGLYPAAVAGLGEDAPFLTLAEYWHVWPTDGMRKEAVATTTDAHGRFAFEDVTLGAWIVRAYRSAQVEAVVRDVRVGEGEHVSGLTLVLPGEHFLSGRLEAPAGTDFTELGVCAVAAGEAGAGRLSLGARVEADGRFRLGPLTPGRVDVGLTLFPAGVLTGAQLHDLHPSAGRILGQAEVGDDVAFDIAGLLPGRVRVHFDPGSTTPPNLRLALVGADAQRPMLYSTQTRGLGPEVLGPRFPSRVDVTLSAGDGSWSEVLARDVAIPSAGVVDVHARLPLARGTLQLLDADTRAPLGEQAFCWYRRTPQGWSTHLARADGQGRWTVELPPSTLALRRLGPEADELFDMGRFMLAQAMGALPFPAEPDADAREVVWTAAGPAQATVLLPR